MSKMMQFDDFTSEDVGNIIMDRIEPSTHRHYYRSSRENAVPDSTPHLSSSPSNSYDTTAGNQDSSALSTSASRLPAPTYRRQPQTRKHLRNQNRFRLPARHFQHRLGLKLNQQRYHRNRRLRVSGGGKYRQPVTYSRGRPSPLQEPQQPSSQERPQRPSDISRLPINITPTSAAPQTSGSVEVIEDNDGRVFIESGIEQNPIPVLTNNVVRNKPPQQYQLVPHRQRIHQPNRLGGGGGGPLAQHDGVRAPSGGGGKRRRRLPPVGQRRRHPGGKNHRLNRNPLHLNRRPNQNRGNRPRLGQTRNQGNSNRPKRRPSLPPVLDVASTPPQELTRQQELLTDDVLSSNRPESLSALPETQTTQPKLTTNFVTEDDHYEVEGFNAVHQLSAGNRGDNGFFTGKPANFPSLFDLVGEFSHNKRQIHPQRRNSS